MESAVHVNGLSVGNVLPHGFDAVDSPPGYQTEGLGAYPAAASACLIVERVKYARGKAEFSPAARGNDIVSLQELAVSAYDDSGIIIHKNTVELIDKVPDGEIPPGVHGTLKPVEKTHVDHIYHNIYIVSADIFSKNIHCIVAAAIIHTDQFKLFEFFPAYRERPVQKIFQLGAVVVQINDQGNEFFFFHVSLINRSNNDLWCLDC